MKNLVKIKFKGPKILSKKVQNNSLILVLNWGQLGTGTTIIKKTDAGYTYEDVGLFKRSFNNLDALLWEFELPFELKEEIESLYL
jgi:hypothetical protein